MTSFNNLPIELGKYEKQILFYDSKNHLVYAMNDTVFNGDKNYYLILGSYIILNALINMVSQLFSIDGFSIKLAFMLFCQLLSIFIALALRKQQMKDGTLYKLDLSVYNRQALESWLTKTKWLNFSLGIGSLLAYLVSSYLFYKVGNIGALVIFACSALIISMMVVNGRLKMLLVRNIL